MSSSHIQSELHTPIAFIIFNRPKMTERVFAEIARAKPKQLFIIADGPRSHVPDDVDHCAAAQQIVERIGWDCEVFRNYSETNLGCKLRVSSGINWVFQQVEEAIILEDDCLPHPSFFRFCQELLDKYCLEARVMHISGSNFFPNIPVPDSYYFSRYPYIWGWATWRRAWQLYDVEVSKWADERFQQQYLEQFEDKFEKHALKKRFDTIRLGEIDTWDYQWTFACTASEGLAATPSRNLVTNIGFGQGATHTADRNDKTANLPLQAMMFPLQHPLQVTRNVELDTMRVKQTFHPESLFKRARRKLRKYLPHA